MSTDRVVPVATDQPIWGRVFTIAPIVIVGSREESGAFNLAPKHLAMPLGWDNYFAFVCSPRHGTYHNIRRHGEFTVSYPRPSDVLAATLAAAPRCEDGAKPSLLLLPTFPARQVAGALVEGCYFYLECALHSVLDGFGRNSLIIGTVVAAAAAEGALRDKDRDDADLIYQSPLLAYLSPGRFAAVRESRAFPFPEGFAR